MISAPRVCLKCGWGIPADAPEGGCPGCLLENGLNLLAEEAVVSHARDDLGQDKGGRADEINREEDSDSVAPSDGRFGIYEIERRPDGSLYELGRGGMGVTYRAIDTTLERKVALKIIKAGMARRSANARERFMREARMAAALRHENIATVYQFGIREDTGQYFYAMELIEGETLEERVRRAGPLSVRTTIDIAQHIVAALAVAEKQGLLHRDLKPANLMLVSPDGETAGAAGNNEKVKIIDFGLAKALHAPTDAESLTRGGFVGTPEFASPEQFEHSSLDVRSDIYSLGATLWFALTGHTPFAGHKVEEVHRAQQSDVLPIEKLKAARVSSGLRSLLESMLALEPACRPGTQELGARLQRCSPEARHVVLTNVALAAAAVLVLGVSGFLVVFSLRTQNSASNRGIPDSVSNPVTPEKSLAVLPFDNLSDNKENTYFADGVQDEILTRLASLADLKVISRTSVMQYKSGTARDLRKIGYELGAAHVVEGSVQRYGNRVRINVHLADARTDTQLWAQTYDRDLADVFAIQSAIAKTIADQLQAKLSPSEKTAIEQPPTSDITAFDLYSRARTLVVSTSVGALNRQKMLQAIDLLNQAVARDPSFFLAQFWLADTHDLIYLLNIDHTPARLALAEAALQAVSRLRPNAGETHLARAEHLYCGYFDYDGALAEMDMARRTLPNSPRVFELTGYIKRRQGKREEGLKNLERSLELDPRNFYTLTQTALSYYGLRRYPEEAAVLDRALTIQPDDVEAKAFRAQLELDWKADTRPLHQTIESIRAQNPQAIQSVAHIWLLCALAERDASAAEAALDAGDESFAFGSNPMLFGRSFSEGLIARVMKDETKERAAFTAARAQQTKIVQAQPDYAPAICMLGLIDAALGRKEEALREGRRATELLPVVKANADGVQMLEYYACIAAWVGEKDLACEQLANATRLSGYDTLSHGQLKLLPFWDQLRGDPRFEKIVEEAKQPVKLR